MVLKNTFVCDFETTVYEGQDHTEVWASALVQIGTEDVKILGSIDETFKYFVALKQNCILYYHNLKFDGSFWLDYLMKRKDLHQAIDSDGNFFRTKEMEDHSFKYLISDMGQWYDIIIKFNGKLIEIRDSLKLLPFSVKRIGKAFKTKHQKLDMEYVGFRYAGCRISDEEKRYIANDVLVVKEALEIMFEEGHTKLTIGACCLEELKASLGGETVYNDYFPDLTKIEIDEDLYGSYNADAYIRKSYHGGWCYVVKGKESKLYKKGLTADVNSLYPSMMSGQSGNYYPTGKPTFWKGEFPKIWNGKEKVPFTEFGNDFYYFVRIRTKFKLKHNMLPTVQIKGSPFYRSTEWLETSDIRDPKTGKMFSKYRDKNGEVKEAYVTMTLTQTDFKLLQDHYDLEGLEILDGCFFEAVNAHWLFDPYMQKYKKIKMESTGAKRELAKLFLNNAYGKLASSTCSNYKIAVLDDNAVDFKIEFREDKKAGYIAVGSAITSYARNFTIRTAQKNFYGADKHGFIYADTDSIHCDLLPEELVDVPVHPTEFCHWKVESCWDEGFFVRQKTYIEHITHEDLEKIEKPYYNVKCAGMPDTAKNLFIASMEGKKAEGDWNERQLEFMSVKRTIKDFKVGLLVPDGKLMPKRIEGGTILVPSDYQIRRSFL